MESRARNSIAIGEVFEQDLIDGEGAVALPAGQQVTEEFLVELTAKGHQKVYFRRPKVALTAPYDSACEKSVKSYLEDAPSLMEDFVNALRMGEPIELTDIDLTLDGALDVIQQDPAAMLSATLESGLTKFGSSFSSRAVRMASMSMVAAELMGSRDNEILAIGRAGMLHDISLPNGVPNFSALDSSTTKYEDTVQSYRQHPLNSAQMLRDSVPCIEELELVLITQVHEQCDGSGFPKGLKKHHLHPLSRMLNIVDAFITLTDIRSPYGAIVPADALAYLTLHTLYGSFDRECLQALMRAAAVYPVGTPVKLSDNQIARVLRSTGGDYLDPVIEVDGEILDLRSADQHILEPAELPGMRRLDKQLLESNLWAQVG